MEYPESLAELTDTWLFLHSTLVLSSWHSLLQIQSDKAYTSFIYIYSLAFYNQLIQLYIISLAFSKLKDILKITYTLFPLQIQCGEHEWSF